MNTHSSTIFTDQESSNVNYEDSLQLQYPTWCNYTTRSNSPCYFASTETTSPPSACHFSSDKTHCATIDSTETSYYSSPLQSLENHSFALPDSFSSPLPYHQHLQHPTSTTFLHSFSTIPPSRPCLFSPEMYSVPSIPIGDAFPSSSSQINRANYTRHQLIMLSEIYKRFRYPNSLQKTVIAHHVGVSRDQIRIWFQNKRRKEQLIQKGLAKRTKSDQDCEAGDYRRRLPDNFLQTIFDELHLHRAAPARLPIKRTTTTTKHQENLCLSTEQFGFNPSITTDYFTKPNMTMAFYDTL